MQRSPGGDDPETVSFRRSFFSLEESRLLADRLRARDAEALAELYDRMGTTVFSIILRITRDSGAAEDVTQDVFLRVWHRFPSFDVGRGSLCRWVLLMARCCAIDYWRSRSSTQSRMNVSIEILDHVVAAGNAPHGWQLYSETMDVRAAMNRLNPKQRQLLELAYFDGLSQAEMAQRLQVPLGTVKTWVRLALRQIREDLDSSPLADTSASLAEVRSPLAIAPRAS